MNGPLSRPTRIAIELSNRCNLNCPFCLVGMQKEQSSVAHDDLDRSFGTMEMLIIYKRFSFFL
jgi:MoaA/NifB/PqqE/SkfB family radical SAM enzyme